MAKETIARYEIQSEIGRGGMAAVYLAYDPNFRRNVAIKLVSSNFQENLVFRERFEREAHLIAKIEHPAIVPVYDFGEQDHQPYLVMRYMPGGSLAVRIIDSRQINTIERNICGEMSFIEDLSGAHTPHTEWFIAHNVVFLLMRL